MTEKLTVATERIDDIPILLAQLDQMQIARLINTHFSTHGNWQGLSLGSLISGWLTFILSEANHRLNHVQPWAQQRLATLQACLDKQLRALDCSDDRLATALDYLSDDGHWENFERALNERSLRVYDLHPQRVRVDSTTAKGYVAVSAEGWFQFGHSKDHRPDLPQVKINLSVLDPLGLPLTTTVVSGEKADDPLYIPEIKRVQQTLRQAGVTYVGDCKMAALATRAYLAASGDYYLCPLPSLQVTKAQLQALLPPLSGGKQVLTPILAEASASESPPTKIAEGYEYTVELTAQTGTEVISWSERRLVVRSLKQAEIQQKSLNERLGRAVAEIAALNERRQGKKRFSREAELQEAVEQIIARRGVKGLVALNYETQIATRAVRRYGSRPAEVRQQSQVQVTTRIAEVALAEAERQLGWRVYATNQPARLLSMQQAVQAYRGEYLVERGFSRLKGKPLSLTPIYLESAARVLGLIRLLMIGLRVLTLIEFVARRQLHKEGSRLAGIYAGNPKRATQRPTAEMMLRVFEGITLTRISEAGSRLAHLTPLTEVQKRILKLFGLSTDVYLCLAQHFSKPLLKMSEP